MMIKLNENQAQTTETAVVASIGRESGFVFVESLGALMRSLTRLRRWTSFVFFLFKLSSLNLFKVSDFYERISALMYIIKDMGLDKKEKQFKKRRDCVIVKNYIED